MNALGASTDMNFLVGQQGSGQISRWSHSEQNFYANSLILIIYLLLSLLFLFTSLSRRDKLSE
jgi:hypothetical protein